MFKDLDISKIVFFLALVGVASIGLFGFGLYSAHKKNAIYQVVKENWENIKTLYSEREVIIDNKPIHFLNASRFEGDGVTINKRPDDGKLIFVGAFFGEGNELRLMRRDGSIVARWQVAYFDHFPDASHTRFPPATNLNIDIHGALINPDGSVVFNYEYGGSVKLSRCNKVLWTLAAPMHHSVEKSERGGYWIPGRRYLDARQEQLFHPFMYDDRNRKYDDDLILRVSEDGEIVEQKSVMEALYENGLEATLTAVGTSFLKNKKGYWKQEFVHVNKIGELPAAIAGAFPQFEAGDLILSLRGYNLLFVIDPDDWRVKWRQTGPWIRQHDPEFLSNGRISVFNNDAYWFELGPDFRQDVTAEKVTNIMEVDPNTGETEIVFGRRPGQEMLSVLRGKQDPTPEGGLFITEAQSGRIIEVDADGEIVWQYVNRYDEEHILKVGEARLYDSKYFDVDNWTCPQGQ